MIGGVYVFNEDYAGVQITRASFSRMFVAYVLLRRVYVDGDLQLPYDIRGYSSVGKGMRIILPKTANIQFIGKVPKEHHNFFNALYLSGVGQSGRVYDIISKIEGLFKGDR